MGQAKQETSAFCGGGMKSSGLLEPAANRVCFRVNALFLTCYGDGVSAQEGEKALYFRTAGGAGAASACKGESDRASGGRACTGDAAGVVAIGRTGAGNLDAV